ncbi:MAG: protein kinase [Anaerolineales bacterium]|nr:protein kinase [Anaerolineales bacterium]
MPIEPGQVIGPYRLVAKLGEGGMGAVYKAEQPAVHRTVAVKVLSANFASDPDALDRFRRELDIIAQLEHPHILPVYDFGEVDGSPYIVMRYMGGGSLHDRLRAGPLPQAEVLDILEQVAQALDFAHARDVIHRDLKPANVLLDESGNAYLADFGLAKTMAGTRDLTATGAILGTPAYMSPEQARGEKLDARSDVYSFAVLAYQALARQLPFTATTAMEYIQKHLTEAPASIRDAVPEYPPAVDGVLGAAMAKARGQRPATAGALMRALRPALAGAPAIAAAVEAPPRAAASATRNPLKPTVLEQAPAARTALAPSPSAAAATRAAPVVPPQAGRRGAGWLLPAGLALAAVGGLVVIGIVIAAVAAVRGALAPRVSTYPVGDAPRAVLAAGDTVWVANFFESSLSALDAANCAAAAGSCGTLRASYPVDDLPVALAFDGQHLWVASALDLTLTQFDPAAGAVVSRHALPSVPSALLLVSDSLWTANDIAGTLTRLGLDGEVVGTYPVGQRPVALASDGAVLWVAVQGDNAVARVALESGAVVDIFPVGGQPSALAYDGERLWVALRDQGAVVALDPSGGAELARVAVGAGPVALLFSGASLWSANQDANSVTRLDVAAARAVATVRVPGGPYALAWTNCGANCGDLWVAGEAGDTVSRVRAPGGAANGD